MSADPTAATKVSGDRRPMPVTVGFIGLVTALSAIGQFATSVYLPSLPAISVAMSAPMSQVQLTLTSFFVTFALAQLIYGPLTDRFGRRPIMLFGLIVYVLATLFSAAAPSIETLILGRALQALGACTGIVVGRAVVRDVVDGPDLARVMAYIALVFAAVPGFAPLLGGFLQEGFGWRAPFLATAALGAAMLVIGWARLPETNTTPLPRFDLIAVFRAYGPLLRSRAFMGYAFTTGLALGAVFAFHVGSPTLFIDVLGVSPAGYGIYPAVTVLGFMIATMVTARLTGRFSSGVLIGLGMIILGAGAALSLIMPLLGILTPVTVTGGIVVFGFGLGLMLPAGVAAAMQDFPERAGTAAAFIGFTHMGGGAIASAVVSALQAPAGVFAFPATMAALTVLAVACYIWVIPASRRTSHG